MSPIISGGTGSGSGSQLVYSFTVTGADKASIDTAVDGTTVASFGVLNVLEVWLLSRTDNAAARVNFKMTLNNDASAIYDEQQVIGINVAASASASVADPGWVNSLVTHGSGGSASYPGVTRITFPGFASTTFWKTGEGTTTSPDATAANNAAIAVSLGYRSTAAITRVAVAGTGTDKFKVGTTLLIFAR